jgi:hypothetical protein
LHRFGHGGHGDHAAPGPEAEHQHGEHHDDGAPRPGGTQ